MPILIGVEIVSEFVETVLLTGKLANTDPVSALLVSTPECGKTSIVSAVVKDSKVKNAIQLSDVTGRGLMELCKGHPEITHFILNDMVTMLSHKQSVNTYTLSVLNAMTEEGIQAAAYPGSVETYAHGKRGIIGCVTSEMLKDQRRWWNHHGLATRLFPFFYDHDEALQIRIKDSIESSQRHLSPKANHKKKFPAKRIAVSIEDKYRARVRQISDTKFPELEDHKGYRRLVQYTSLVKAHALLRKDKKVTDKDIDFLHRIGPYVSYKRPAKL